MDMEELTPAPWFYNSYRSIHSVGLKELQSQFIADWQAAGEPSLDKDTEWGERWYEVEAIVACVPPHHGDTAVGRRAADAEFIALARNAFDVMMRRGWSALKSPAIGEGWRVDMNDGTYFAFDLTGQYQGGENPAEWPDPFTALVEADKWYRENVEKE